jgi:hypothetical protein
MPKNRLNRLKRAKRGTGRGQPKKKLDLMAVMAAEVEKLEKAGVTDKLSAISRVGIACSSRMIDSFKFSSGGGRRKRLAKDIAAYRIKGVILLSRGLNEPVFVGTLNKFLRETVEMLNNYETTANEKLDRQTAAKVELVNTMISGLISSHASSIARKTTLSTLDVESIAMSVGFAGTLLAGLLKEKTKVYHREMKNVTDALLNAP